VSPDGQLAAVLGLEQSGPESFRQRLALLDLGTGDLTELTESFDSPAVWWSPDSRFAFYLSNQELSAHDTTTGETIAVSDDLGRLTTFAIRPTAAADSG
jgi:hypothetical protein